MAGPSDVKVTFLVEAATQAAVAALDNYKKKSAELAAQIERDGGANTRSVNAQVAAGKALANANEFVAQQTRKATDAMRAEAAAASGVTTAVSQSGSALRAHGSEAEDAAGKVDKVAHSSTGVRRELLVLAHELSQGNYSRFGGSLLVLGERTDALGKIMTPTGLAIGGVVVAIAALGYEAFKEEQNLKAFNNTLLLTGGFAGITRDQYESMVQSIARSSGSGLSPARDALLGLVQSGQFVGPSLEPIARAILAIAKASGETAEDVTKDFAKMGDGVLKWVDEHNKQYNFLTLSERDHIQTLEREGKAQEAAVLAADLLSKSVHGQAAEVGVLRTAWLGLGDIIHDALHAAVAAASADSPAEAVQKQADKVAEIRKRLASHTSGNALEPEDLAEIRDRALLVAAQQTLYDLLKKNSEEQAAKLAKSREDQHNKEQIEAKQFEDKRLSDTHAGRQRLLDQEIADIRRNAALLKGTKDEVSQAEQDAQIAAARDKYADKTPRSTGPRTASGDNVDAGRILKAQLDQELAELSAAVSRREETEAAALATSRELWAQHYASVIKSLETAVANAGTPAIRARLASQLEAARTESLAKDSELQAKQTELARKGETDRQKIVGETSKSAGDIKAAELDRIEASYLEWIEKLRSEGVTDWKRLADDWKAEQLRAVDVSAVKRQIEAVQADLGRQEARIQVQVQTGNLTKTEGSSNLEAASARASGELARLRGQLQSLLASDPQNEQLGKYIDDLSVKIEQLPVKARTPMEVMFAQWRDTTNAMEQATASWIDKGVDGLSEFVTTGKFQLSEFVRSALADFAKIQIRGAIAGLAGGGTATAGSGAAAAIGAVASAVGGASSAPPTSGGSTDSSGSGTALVGAATALKGAATQTAAAAGDSSGSAGQWGILSTIWNAVASYLGITQTTAAETSAVSLTTAAIALQAAAFELVAAAVQEEAAAVASSFATGGHVTGAGTETSDSIDAKLSHNEYVLNAAAVRRVGVPFLDRINSGETPRRAAVLKLATGGLVTQGSIGSTSNGNPPGAGVVINTPINISVPESTSREDSERISRETGRQIRAAIENVLGEQMRPGGMLAGARG